ncbi:MAG TPA: cytidine deaminase [Leptospiraceae bacterium]|nr:cytidine deaminase [Leptospiraceae bacterium]
MKVDFDGDFENLKIQTDLFRNFSYSPYSNFSVGAAVVATLKDKQKIVVYGTNVENASYGLTICAERAAFVELIQYKPESIDLVVVAVSGAPASPCGACRQFISEFTHGCPVWLVGNGGKTVEITNLLTLLPKPFGPGSLKL